MITGLYILPLIFIWMLAFIRIVRLRRSRKIGLGSGGDPELRQAVRAYGNFVEIVPLALIIMFLLETSGASLWAIHGFGAVLVVSRIAHLQGLWQSAGSSYGRMIGAAATLVLLPAGAIGLFYLAI